MLHFLWYPKHCPGGKLSPWLGLGFGLGLGLVLGLGQFSSRTIVLEPFSTCRPPKQNINYFLDNIYQRGSIRIILKMFAYLMILVQNLRTHI